MSRVYQLAPSILSADFNRLGEQIQRVEKAECRWLHIDIMDGMFVPSISFGMPVVKSIRKESSLYFDVHMMVKDPERYVEEFQSCGADMITVHAEACRDLAETVKRFMKQAQMPGCRKSGYAAFCGYGRDGSGRNDSDYERLSWLRRPEVYPGVDGEDPYAPQNAG